MRLLYAGTTSDATGNGLLSSLTDEKLGYTNKTSVAFNTSIDHPGYVGYMYGNTLGSSYAEENSNDNSSTIKEYLDSWYEQNLLSYADYIADSGFCGDRSLSPTTSGNGYNTTGSITYYGGYYRYNTSQSPSLSCSTNDLYTTSTSSEGNQSLTYPIDHV